ncbi:GFA family protein [Sphingorhabdus sp. EL138]|jgi:hypothetical protein|uniref:GFA family protein n=1 Tax=Sphingorhabdus sp. EL138 TaxID=2073156 RepID=UPI000D68B9CC
MKVDGHCHCGKIIYEANVDPTSVQICHCQDCQTLTGSAFRVAIPATPENFRLLQGDPRVYLKVADSGSRRGHAFCGDCGAPVFRLPTDNNPNYALRVGGLDQRDELEPPARQIWTKRRLSWVTAIGNIPEVSSQI